MGQEGRTASVLPGEERTMDAQVTEDSAPAGCTEIAVSGDCPDSDRTGGEDVVGGDSGTEGGAEAGRSGGEGHLRGFLQDLLEREGRGRTAERLGVSQRTLRRALAAPQLSPFMVEALQRELQVDAEKRAEPEEEQPVSLSEQLQQLERRLAELEHIAGDQLEELWAAGEDLHQIRAAYAPHPERGAVGHGLRAFDSLLTVEPLPDDAEVYGEALPVVAEWRRALRALGAPPHTLAWLDSTERLLRLEIQLIDDRRLTLPPADVPWDDVRRESELLLRQDRLRRLRIERLWTAPLHWLLRFLTLGRWGRGVSLEQQLQGEFEARRDELLSAGAGRRAGRIGNGRGPRGD